MTRPASETKQIGSQLALVCVCVCVCVSVIWYVVTYVACSMLVATNIVVKGNLEVILKTGHTQRYGSPFRCLALPIFEQRDCLVYAQLLTRGMTYFMSNQFVLNPPYNHVVPSSPPRVLRVGLFTADLAAHAMIQLLAAFMLNRPRDNYVLHLFHSRTDRQRYEWLMRAANGETDVTDMDDLAVAQEVHRQKIDVVSVWRLCFCLSRFTDVYVFVGV